MMMATGPQGPIDPPAFAFDPDADLSPKELAALLGKTERTIRRWCQGEEFPAIRVGGTWTIKPRRLQQSHPDLWEELYDRAMRRTGH